MQSSITSHILTGIANVSLQRTGGGGVRGGQVDLALFVAHASVERASCVSESQGVGSTIIGNHRGGTCSSALVSNAYPGKFLLVVDTQISGLFMRAKVSCGPPKQAAQDGEAGVTHPASSKIWAAVLPSQPATGSV